MTQLSYIAIATGLLAETKDITGSGHKTIEPLGQDYFVMPHVRTTPYTTEPEYLMGSIIYHRHLQTPHKLERDS